MFNIKNKIISVRSTLGKDRTSKKRKKPKPAKELQPKNYSMSGLKAALIMLPLFVAAIVAVVLIIVFRQVSEITESKQTSVTESSAVSTPEDNNKLLVLVSPKSPLPRDFENDLTEYENIQIDRAVEKDLSELMKNSAESGVSLMLKEGYVSPQKQNELYQDEVRRLMARKGQSSARAAEDAELTVPMGNHADAQTGLSVRFSSAKTLSFSESEEYLWLLKNAYKYGFIQRYPDGKKRYTDFEEDTSLFRYVGKENALKLKTLNMCLDEYIIYLNSR